MGDGIKNEFFMCGGFINCVLHVTTDQKGPLKMLFDKRYDIRVYVSETNKDPTPINCSYHMPLGKRHLLMDPVN